MNFKLYLFCFFLIAFQSISSQTYRKELETLYNIAGLPHYRNDEIAQISSYDTTGGNDDGFSGKYSYLRKEGDELVVADLKGPGLINRIWTPTPSNDTIRFYFDGEKIPRINMPFINLFSGKVAPFLNPICGNEIGGFYCYLPISYQKSLKIVYKGTGLKFHQIQYRTLDKKEKIETFSFELLKQNEDIINKISQLWNKNIKPTDIYPSGEIKKQPINLTLRAGESVDLFTLNHGGRIIGMELNMGDGLTGMFRDVWLTTQWDDESQKAMDLPLSDFFGYAFGKSSMHAFPAGSTGNLNYNYLPMPFDQSAKMKLNYVLRKDDIQKDILITGTIYYSEQKRDPATEGKLYTQWRREINPEKGKPYLIADVKGRGHYVGTILIAQGLEEGMTLFWEGDDCSTVDGKMKMHGTGSEDYFNGGWYAVTDRWDRGISMPIHGSLVYDLKTARTGGYRFFLSDKINFSSDYKLTIEHGPEENKLKVDYASVAFFYAANPVFSNTSPNAELNKLSLPAKHILMAQDLTARLYWFTNMDFKPGFVEFTSKREDTWMTNIDFEAVPMVQLDLEGLDYGKYKLYVTCKEQAKGNPFAVWQRTRPVSNWIEQQKEATESTTVYAGEIEITEQIKTITLRKKKMDDTSIIIHSFTFEKL